jgi:putative endonuclease
LSRAAGDAAERRAAEFLVKVYGYKVIARNYTCRFGEIDLICEDGVTLAFIEVRHRTRDRFGEAIETLTYQKLKRIGLTARHFLMRNQLEQRECRFDVVMIQGTDEPKLTKDAFRADF